jgi:acetyl esterase/lipase
MGARRSGFPGAPARNTLRARQVTRQDNASTSPQLTMPIPNKLSRRAFMGAPAALSFACRVPPVPTPMVSDVSYGPHSSQCLDVYSANGEPGRAAPLVVMIHGGGWESGSRGDVVKFIPAFTSQRYVVANVGYRVSSEAMAPAAAEDARIAIQCARLLSVDWGADSNRMLLVGFSAGAHLALLSALAPPAAIGGPQSRVRGMISFWGITDVTDLLDGDHTRGFARRWIPESPERLELSRRLSPINYDVADAPTLCAVHSVHDNVVPFAHSERLVAKFQNAKRPSKLIELSHHGHAAPMKDYPAIFRRVFRFLNGTGVMN